MSRKLAISTVALLVALTVGGLAPSAGAASGGACQLQGTASFAPGLTNSDQAFNYSFNGGLSSCQSNVPGAPSAGQVSAGEVITVAGVQYQEPVPSGTGSCAKGNTSGIAIATWADGTKTVVNYTTDAVAAAVHLSGTVIPSVTLPAVPPATGSTTITTNRYAGSSALGLLAFEADAAACNTPSGVTSAGIAGLVGLGSAT